MKRGLFEQCGLIAFLFLLLSPGFGFQYLTWTVPWTVHTPTRRTMIAYHADRAALCADGIRRRARRIRRAGVYADLLNPAPFPGDDSDGDRLLDHYRRLAVNTATLWVDRNPAPPARPGDRGSIAAVPDC